jgi:hypothetical protein
VALVIEWLIPRWTRQEVVSLISRGEDPHRDDVALALIEIPGEPVPQAVIDYVRATYVIGKPRKTGPCRPAHEQALLDFHIQFYYRQLCEYLREREQTARVKEAAIRQMAQERGVSRGTIRRVLKKTRRAGRGS